MPIKRTSKYTSCYQKRQQMIKTIFQNDDVESLGEAIGSRIHNIRSSFLARLGDPFSERVFHSRDFVLETTSGNFRIFGTQAYLDELDEDFGALHCQKIESQTQTSQSQVQTDLVLVGQQIKKIEIVAETLTFSEHGATTGKYQTIVAAVFYLDKGCMVVSKVSHNSDFISVEFLEEFALRSWAPPSIRYEEYNQYRAWRELTATGLKEASARFSSFSED
jgi:hypothetical protein